MGIEHLKKIHDTQCCVEGISYDNALELIKELSARTIDANIVTGGVQIYANAKDARVIRVCDMFSTKPSPGTTMKREDAIIRR